MSTPSHDDGPRPAAEPRSAPDPVAPDEVVVDARGLRCPAPIVALARAARGLPPGTRVSVLATDPAAATDVPAWARMRGHLHLATVREDADVLRLTVELRAPTGPAPAPDMTEGPAPHGAEPSAGQVS